MAYKKYTVRQGDCLSSIAYKSGLFPSTIWDDPQNAGLKEKRKDPNVLYPGDEIYILDKRKKEESCAGEQRHRFRKKNTPVSLRLRLLDENDQPRVSIKYELLIDGRTLTGVTDSEGMIDHPISPDASTGRLVLEDLGTLTLQLGALDPADTVQGTKQRLRNLGHECPASEAEWNEDCEDVLARFQKSQGLTATGQADTATRDKLRQLHGS